MLIVSPILLLLIFLCMFKPLRMAIGWMLVVGIGVIAWAAYQTPWHFHG